MRKTVCSLEGCERVGTVRRGFCDLHYNRWRRHGDPMARPLHQRTGVSREERFWAKVDKNGPVPEYAPHLGPCWLWTAARYRAGYGHFGMYGLAHRISYELLVGPIPEGLFIDHLCRVRPCVNPAHMEPVTNGENIRRGTRSLPHSVGEANVKAKLTEAQVREIRRLHAGGVRYGDLSASFGVCYSTVTNIIYGRTWKHVL